MVHDARLDQVRQNRQGGMNDANPTSLIANFDQAGLGIVSEGYWGFPIRKSTTFKGALYVKQPAARNNESTVPAPVKSLTIALKSADGNTIYAATQVNGFSNDWKRFDIELTTTAT